MARVLASNDEVVASSLMVVFGSLTRVRVRVRVRVGLRLGLGLGFCTNMYERHKITHDYKPRRD